MDLLPRRPERSAAPSIRGYFAQILYGTLRWLSLAADEVLICEGNEDIDRHLFDASGRVREVTEEQIKLLEGSISARDEDVYESIFNFLRAFHELHSKGTPCALVFTTSATRAKQRITDVSAPGVGLAGRESAQLHIDVLSNWQDLPDGPSATVVESKTRDLANALHGLSAHHLPPEPTLHTNLSVSQLHARAVRSAIRYLDDESLWPEFLRSVRWNLGQKGLSDLHAEIVEKLKIHPRTRDLPAEVLAQRLVMEVLAASGKKDVGSRRLDAKKLSDLCHSTQRELDEWLKIRQAGNVYGWITCLELRIEELRRRIDEVSERVDRQHSLGEAVSPASIQMVDGFRGQLLAYPRSRDPADVALTKSKPAHVPAATEVYQPLRLSRRDPSGAASGPAATVGADELLARVAPMVVRGPGGAGKTTWLTHSFRDLLESAKILPVLIILRKVAHEWNKTSGDRSVEAHLRRWAFARGGPSGETVLRAAISFPDSLRLALLVDGWDELGSLGDEFREKFLAFKATHPNTLIVVTSRPYDSGQPALADGFDVFDLCPLSQEEVFSLAKQHAAGASTTDQEAVDHLSRFEAAYRRSKNVRTLSETPLLLTMLLRLSKVGDLPERRHLLYKRCIHDLLARSEHKLRDGADLAWDQWHSSNGDENLRAVARLAASALSDVESVGERLLVEEEKLLAALPTDWPAQPPSGLTTFTAQQSFVRWLAGAAGLLNEPKDGLYEFAHQSLQEYLAAVHLDAEHRDASSKATEVLRRSKYEHQWDVLIYWAGIMSESGVAALDVVLGGLISAEGLGLDLAGIIFAEGLGSAEMFERWVRSYVASVERWVRFQGTRCEQAWASSSSDDRRDAFALALADAQQVASFPVGSRLLDVARHSQLKLPDRTSSGNVVTKALWDVLKGTNERRAHIAAGRIFCGAEAGWPSYDSALAMLNLWPGHRRVAGLRFQLAVVCGASRSDLHELAPVFFPPPRWDEASRARASDIAKYMSHLIPARPASQGWEENPDDILNRRAFVTAVAQRAGLRWILPWMPPPTISLGGAMTVPTGLSNYAANWIHHAVAPERNLGRALRFRLAPDELDRWRLDLHLIDSLSLGIYGTRGAFATRGYLGSHGFPLLSFMGPACRLSLEPGTDPTTMKQEVARYEAEGGDRLWTALARHIARCSDQADRDLLTKLATDPQERPEPLQWGLQYIVRGDVMLGDGQNLSLDQLADEAGLAPLPLLEDQPEELDVTV